MAKSEPPRLIILTSLGDEMPWPLLPATADFVLTEDLPYVRVFNGYNVHDLNRIHTECIPQPMFGRRDAPVVVLFSNPTFNADELSIQQENIDF